MIVRFSQFLASGRRISSFLTSDSDSACRNPPLAHLQTPGNLQKPGSKLNSVFLLFCFVFCFVFYGLGGTGGGFGAPGGGFSDNRSGGKPPLLLRLKKPPPGAPKPPPGPPKHLPNRSTKRFVLRFVKDHKTPLK